MRLAYLILAGLLCLAASAGAVRTEITATEANQNGYEGFTWFALNSAGHYFNTTVDGKQLLVVNTTTTATANAQNLTVVAGSFWRSDLGNVTFPLATNHTYVLGPFESSWFKQANETLWIDTNATRGSIALVQLP
jgi:hypothetical protein